MVMVYMRIIKRKVGSTEYFYMQHTVRRDGKAVTTEWYLGKKIPVDIAERMRVFSREQRKEVHTKFSRIREAFQAEWQRMPSSAKQKALGQLAVIFTYNTNAIEGSTITLEETRDIIERQISPHRPMADVKETEAHSKAFLAMLEGPEGISERMVLGWHERIFSETKPDIAGRYRDYRVRVGDHVAPDWQDVPALVSGFFRSYQKSVDHPVDLAARLHYRFEQIHPFGDGNGRVGRMMINHILWHAGYPMIIIEYKNRRSYYQAFRKDEQHFVNYFTRRYLQVHKDLLKEKGKK